MFWHGIYNTVLSRVEAGGVGKTFLYYFDLDTEMNYVKNMFLQSIKADGASHGDDIGYLFPPSLPGGKLPGIDSVEFALIKKMVAVVTSFIINGDPNSSGVLDSTWQPVSGKNHLECLHMANDSFKLVQLPDEERFKALNEIFESVNVSTH